MKLIIYLLSFVLLVAGVIFMASGNSMTGAVTGATQATSDLFLFFMGVLLIATSFLLVISGMMKTGFELTNEKRKEHRIPDEEFRKEFLDVETPINSHTETETKPSN